MIAMNVITAINVITVADTSKQSFPIDVATPQMLWLLLLLPVWWILRYLRRPPTITFSRVDVVRKGPTRSGWYVKLLFVMHNLMLILLIVALARPRLAQPTSYDNQAGIDIELVVDLSSSMLAQDFQPRNRLEVAKQSLRDFVTDRPNDRIGLVAFASEAYTVTPVTSDHAVLLQDIGSLEVGQLDDGTALGDAIVSGANRLYKSPSKSKVLILMTDGVNNRGTLDPMTGAKAASTFGIKIYTIGVGTQGTAPVPVATEDGSPKVEMQPVQIDETLLRDVARATGGQYFRATDGAGLRQVYKQIDQMEQTTIRSVVPAHFQELFRWPLGLAIVLLLASIMLAAARGPLP